MTSQSPAVSAHSSAIKKGSPQQSSTGIVAESNVGPASNSPGIGTAANATSAAELRKQKRRVDPAKRKRIALACDSCKRRKQKCNGDHPCSICKKKNFVCHYTPTRSDLVPGRSPSVAFSSLSPHATGDLDDSMSVTTETASEQPRDDRPCSKRHSSTASRMSTEHSEEQPTTPKKHRRRVSSRKQHVSNESSISDSSASNPASPDTSIPSPAEVDVQENQPQQRYRRKRSHSRSEYQVETVGDGRNTRLLWDSKGHMRYMGESGVHSFLEQSRKAFRKVMGDSSFTLDPAQFRFIDGPTHTASVIPLQLPPRSLTNELIQAFDDNVQAFDYVFDMDQFRYQVAQTYRNPMGAPRHWLCLLHFTCALGAVFVSSKQELDTEKFNIPPFSGIDHSQSSSANIQGNNPKESGSKNIIDPALFFESGLGLMSDAAEDGDLWVVQAYLLMCLYYQIICKRNASWIQLGTAIRFAQALGMHRKCVNMTFSKPQRIVRQRLWLTLYIQDRFWSSSLGRPLAIDDCDWDDRDTSELILLNRTVVELSKLCEIIGDICLLVYRPQSISSSTSQRLATRLREWSDGLPPDIQLTSLHLNAPDDRKLSVSSVADEESRRQMIRNQGLLRLHLTHLNSIILLTRPFFLLMVAKAPSEIIPAQAKTVSRLSSACVLCAARSVDLVMTFFAHNQQPIRSHLMTYFIFTAGIVLLLESFHQRRSEVESYITRGIFLCIFILGHYGKCDPSAKRYRNILQEMDRAARASRTLNYANAANGATADDQNKHISPIKDLLNRGGPVMPRTTGETTVGTYFMPSPRNSSIRSRSRSRKSVDESAVAAAAAAAAAQAYQQAANVDYDDEKYLHDLLGYGYNKSSMGSDSTTNLSRMFLKAAANDGRYQLPDSPVVGMATPAIQPNDDNKGIEIPTPVESFLPPPATTTPGSKEVALNISPADAMSQFLMDDTFGVGGGNSEDPNMDFSFDLEMMDWINAANLSGNNNNNTNNNPAGAATNAGTTRFTEAVSRANVELFNGPGSVRQAVGTTGSAGQPPFYGNDTVFRGLMMNAEY
ncbi:fungal-specific transcription factor domain-containing protein [Lipomyces kononenkoae]|uniref:Fungal-specific transcription factor domain-containing protein n=1 Tax=Lipomyces kononenkoae TaxID=34357 RepID=A0ACC3T7I2_LIPKO